jgi:hypothetical protein
MVGAVQHLSLPARQDARPSAEAAGRGGVHRYGMPVAFPPCGPAGRRGLPRRLPPVDRHVEQSMAVVHRLDAARRRRVSPEDIGSSAQLANDERHAHPRPTKGVSSESWAEHQGSPTRGCLRAPVGYAMPIEPMPCARSAARSSAVQSSSCRGQALRRHARRGQRPCLRNSHLRRIRSAGRPAPDTNGRAPREMPSATALRQPRPGGKALRLSVNARRICGETQ